MGRYILKRLLQGLFTLWAMTIVVFILARVSGDPAYLLAGDFASPQDIAAIRAELGLDRSWPEQYWLFIQRLGRADLGRSLVANQSVTSMLAERIPPTLKLAGVAFLFAVLIAVPMGVVTAVKRDTWVDTLGKAFAILGMATPNFWLGIMLILVLAVGLGWLPAGGIGGPQNLILPAITLGWAGSAGIMRLTRSAMLDVMDSEYIKLARVKGVAGWLVIWKHALRNALIPPLTLAGVVLAQLLTGSVITEQVFAYPGLGQLAINSVSWRDYPVLQGVVLVYATIFIITSMVVDILYAYIDPRIRYSK
jgi:peptide/nickel transport system permease protein